MKLIIFQLLQLFLIFEIFQSFQIIEDDKQCIFPQNQNEKINIYAKDSEYNQNEACIICQYTIQKLIKSFDLAQECPDSLDFQHQIEKKRTWTPDEFKLKKLITQFQKKFQQRTPTKVSLNNIKFQQKSLILKNTLPESTHFQPQQIQQTQSQKLKNLVLNKDNNSTNTIENSSKKSSNEQIQNVSDQQKLLNQIKISGQLKFLIPNDSQQFKNNIQQFYKNNSNHSNVNFRFKSLNQKNLQNNDSLNIEQKNDLNITQIKTLVDHVVYNDLQNQTQIEKENKLKNEEDTKNNKSITFYDIKHPKTTKYLDRNKGIITTKTDLGLVEKTTILNPDKNSSQYQEIENNLNDLFQKSDKIVYLNQINNQSNSNPAEFGNLNPLPQTGVKGIIETDNNNKTNYDYQSDIKIQQNFNTSLERVQTTKNQGVNINDQHFPYGKSISQEKSFEQKDTSNLNCCLTEPCNNLPPCSGFSNNSQSIIQQKQIISSSFLQEQVQQSPQTFRKYQQLIITQNQLKKNRFNSQQWQCAESFIKKFISEICENEISISFVKYCKILKLRLPDIVESYLYQDKAKKVCQSSEMCPGQILK